MKNLAHEKDVVHYDTGEVETLNDNFVQLYLDNIDLMSKIIGENPTAAKVFMWLIKHMDKRNALVISQPALADGLNLSVRTIQYATAYLKKMNAVNVLKSGNTNIYAVNAQIAWKSDARGKQYAWFDAKVYISEFEQEKDEDKPLFNTQLVGHAVPKQTKTKRQKTLDDITGIGGPAVMIAISIFSLTQIFL